SLMAARAESEVSSDLRNSRGYFVFPKYPTCHSGASQRVARMRARGQAPREPGIHNRALVVRTPVEPFFEATRCCGYGFRACAFGAFRNDARGKETLSQALVRHRDRGFSLVAEISR